MPRGHQALSGLRKRRYTWTFASNVGNQRQVGNVGYITVLLLIINAILHSIHSLSNGRHKILTLPILGLDDAKSKEEVTWPRKKHRLAHNFVACFAYHQPVRMQSGPLPRFSMWLACGLLLAPLVYFWQRQTLLTNSH